MDYRQLYDLESYLFETVSSRFAQDGHLTAFDFFCIVTWKSPRPKTRIASALLSQGHPDLDTAVQALTTGIASQPSAKERFRYLWGQPRHQSPAGIGHSHRTPPRQVYHL